MVGIEVILKTSFNVLNFQHIHFFKQTKPWKLLLIATLGSCISKTVGAYLLEICFNALSPLKFVTLYGTPCISTLRHFLSKRSVNINYLCNQTLQNVSKMV